MDRTKEPGSIGEPLYQDVVSALYEAGKTGIKVVGGRYGLGSKDTPPASAFAVFEELKKDEPKREFTIGIVDDVTNLSLPEAESMGRDFLRFDQGFIRKSFYAVARPLGLDRAMVGPRAIRYARGLELLDLHVPVNLVQKFLGQQKASQIAAFLNFSDGAARRMVQNKTLGPSSGTDPLCNSFLGIVEDISVGMRMASVSVRTFGDMRLGVQCSTRQFVHMEIHANQVVTVLVDPEQIVLSRSRATLSMGNCLPCTVQSIHQDQVESFVSLELGDGSRLCATVETPGLLRVGIYEGQKVYAHFPSRAARLCLD